MKTIAIIQARIGSTRLPGKVMRQLCGKSVLAHVISRVQACPLVDEVVVATTTLPADDIIVDEVEKYGAKWFRGSEKNVLERYYLAAKQYEADVIVRVTSDCPLFDPDVLSEMLDYFKTETSQGLNIDYLSNCLNLTYPRGLDVEIFTFKTLEKTYQHASKQYEHEHVTPYIYENPEIFSLHGLTWDTDFSNHRWTLDTEEDWQLIAEVYSALYQDGRIFTTHEVLELFHCRPEMLQINASVKQKQLG